MKYTIHFSRFEEHERAVIENLCHLVKLEWLDLQREDGICMRADLTVEGARDDITEFELKCALLDSTVSNVVSEFSEPQPVDVDFEVSFKVRTKLADRANAAERLHRVLQRALRVGAVDLTMLISELQVRETKDDR